MSQPQNLRADDLQHQAPITNLAPVPPAPSAWGDLSGLVAVATPRLRPAEGEPAEHSVPATVQYAEILTAGALALRLRAITRLGVVSSPSRLSSLAAFTTAPAQAPITPPSAPANQAIPSQAPTNQPADDHLAGDHVVGDHVVGDHVVGDHVVGDHAPADAVVGDHVLGDNAAADPVVGDHVVGDHAPADPVVGDHALGDRVARDQTVPARAIGNHAPGNLALRDRVVGDHAESAEAVGAGAIGAEAAGAGAVSAGAVGAGAVGTEAVGAETPDAEVVGGRVVDGGTVDGGTFDGVAVRKAAVAQAADAAAGLLHSEPASEGAALGAVPVGEPTDGSGRPVAEPEGAASAPADEPAAGSGAEAGAGSRGRVRRARKLGVTSAEGAWAGSAAGGAPGRAAGVGPVVPDARAWASRLVQAVSEVLAGDRPISQLVRFTDDAVFTELNRRVRLLGLNTTATTRGAKERSAVRSVRVCMPVDNVAEVAAHVRHGERSRAIALRMEIRRNRWICTAIELG